MIINNTFGFIFVHVPKAAGTTVSSLLSRLSTYCDIEVGGTAMGEALQPYFQKRFGLSKHSTAQEIKRVVGEVVWKRYFTFGFVRNPYERVHSSYHFLRRMRAETQMPSLAPMDGFASFREFVCSDYFLSEGMDRILMPQLFWLRKNQKELQLAVDFIGRVESLQRSIMGIASHVPGMAKSIAGVDIPNLNRSVDSKNDPAECVAGDSVIEARIFEKYRIDFQVFGYSRVPV
jgi:hypothetical protein